MKSVKPEEWKIYLKWHLLTAMASYLNSDFDKENFRFYGTVLTGATEQKPRWKRVQGTVGGSLGEIVGKIYVEKYFPPEAKKKMLDLVNNLKASFRDRFQKLTWMSPETKTKAIDKLDKIIVKIGYPDKWRDYSKLDIKGDSYIINVMNSASFEFDYQLSKINKPVDPTEWSMNPQTVNAYYNPSSNEIVFPAAILQPPFFNLEADDAVNYGSIGYVIAHEMTHGFDDQGRLYDAAGNLSNWWTSDDSLKFTQQVKSIIDQFNKFNVKLKDTTVYVNGELTQGENIADFGGLTISLNAFKMTPQGSKPDEKIDGFTSIQRFFLSYGQTWKQIIRDEELMKRIKEDVHSPGRFRVNGAIRNVPEFYKAFNIKPENKLYLAEKDRAIIW
jgi:putative endopeptidase